jgi:hypothetical protein
MSEFLFADEQNHNNRGPGDRPLARLPLRSAIAACSMRSHTGNAVLYLSDRNFNHGVAARRSGVYSFYDQFQLEFDQTPSVLAKSNDRNFSFSKDFAGRESSCR